MGNLWRLMLYHHLGSERCADIINSAILGAWLKLMMAAPQLPVFSSIMKDASWPLSIMQTEVADNEKMFPHEQGEVRESEVQPCSSILSLFEPNCSGRSNVSDLEITHSACFSASDLIMCTVLKLHPPFEVWRWGWNKFSISKGQVTGEIAYRRWLFPHFKYEPLTQALDFLPLQLIYCMRKWNNVVDHISSL